MVLLNCFLVSCGTVLLILFFYPEIIEFEKNQIRATVTNIYGLILTIVILYRVFRYFITCHNGNKDMENLPMEPVGLNISRAKNKEIQQNNQKISAIHEAGHAVMLYLQGEEYFNVVMSDRSPHVTTAIKLKDANELKKEILVLYAGAAAEEIILGEFHSGCMGAYNADFETASRYLKSYLIMRDNSLSKTLLDVELSDQMIELSKEFYKQAVNILNTHLEFLKAVSEKLKEKTTITQNEVKKIAEDKGTDKDSSEIV